MSEKNIVDEAARARNILAKDLAVKVSSRVSREIGLQREGDPIIGEHSVLVLVGPTGSHQYTLCHPIGVTDLAPDDWVIIPTDEIPATITRMDDPRRDVVNKKRTAYKQQLLVGAKLLYVKEVKGTQVFFYPSDRATPRNSVVNEAKASMREKLAPLRSEYNTLKAFSRKARKEKNQRIQELHALIQQGSDLLDYMSEGHRQDEVNLRNFSGEPSFVRKCEQAHPTLHRTLVGPYGDQPQRAITGAKGYPMVDVIGALRKHMVSLDLSRALGSTSSAKQNTRAWAQGRRGGRNQKGGNNKKPPPGPADP